MEMYQGGKALTRDSNHLGNAGGSLVHLGQDNRLDMNCISQLPIYRSDDKECPAAGPDGSCLFGYHTDYP